MKRALLEQRKAFAREVARRDAERAAAKARKMVVIFEETGERREVKKACRRCGLDASILQENGYQFYYVVSPNGTAHHGNDYGVTDCGIDATRDGWWWPL